MLRWICCGLITLLSNAVLAGDDFDVIAVEYPPFTSSKMVGGGVVFDILRQAYPQYSFKPLFLPPKRAYNMMQNGQWCMSFYPGNESVASHKIKLTEHNIVIGLIRLRQTEPFRWERLDELAGLNVALLRSGDSSAFSSKFQQAGMLITYTETIQQSLDLMLRQRVDLAMYDDYNFEKLAAELRDKIQFSESMLLQTPVTLFTNPRCNDPLPKETTLRPLPAVSSQQPATL